MSLKPFNTNVAIDFQATDVEQAKKAKEALIKIGEKLTAENLIFLGELTSKPKVNEKLKSKHGMIKAFL